MIYIYKVTLINDGIETVISKLGTQQGVPKLKSGSIKLGINTIDSFTFSMLYNNPGYNLIKPRKTLVKVLNTKTNKLIFEGRVLLPGQSMGSSPLVRNVTCESELGYLMDSTQTYGEYHDVTVKQFLEIMVANHNAVVEDYKKFTVGNVTVTDPNDSLYRYLGYEKTLATIKDKLLDRLGGELQIRKENDIRYLDYVPAIGSKKDTIIRMFKSIKTIEEQKDPTGIVNRLKPLGAKINGTDERLTIASVNNGAEYLDNLEAQAEYGIVQDVQIWDDVNDPTILMTKGTVALSEATKIKKQYKIDALELALIDKDPDTLDVGDTYRTVNPVMGLDEDLRIIEKTIDIHKPELSQYTFGDKIETMSGKQASVNKIAAFVQSIMTGTGNIDSSFLEGYLSLLKVQMGAMADTAEKQQVHAILFEDRVPGSPSFGATAIGTQGIMIAYQLDGNNNWIWRTFGTGKGFFADLIIAGKLLGGAVEFDLDAGTLKIFHSDTTYSIFSADGVKRVINGVEYDYSCLAYTGTAIIPDDQNSIEIQLPDRFKNKNFTVTTQASSLQNLTDGFALKTYEVGVSSYDYPNGKITINGTCIATQISNTSNSPKIDFAITFMVVA